MTVELSIVSPMYNEELCIEAFVAEVTKVMKGITESYELVLVDDGSRDRSYEVARSLAEKNPRIRVIKFSRNFGHQMALFAGLKYADGEKIVMMDSDLQHPPELIPVLLAKAAEGYDIVHTVRESTDNENVFRSFAGKMFYYLINYLSYTPIIPGAADFRLVSRRVNNVFISLSEFDRFNRGLFSWIGFKSAIVEYRAHERFAGRSNYTFKRLMSLTLSSVTSFSGKPLRLSLYLGMLTLSILGVYLIFVCYNFFVHDTARGWSSLFFSISMLGSVQLISIGVLGEYIFRIYNEVKGRPHFIVEENFSKGDQLAK